MRSWRRQPSATFPISLTDLLVDGITPSRCTCRKRRSRSISLAVISAALSMRTRAHRRVEGVGQLRLHTGIAYLVPAANGSTNVSVLIAKVLPGWRDSRSGHSRGGCGR